MQLLCFLIVIVVIYGFCDKIIDLAGKKYVRTEVNIVYNMYRTYL